MEKRPTTIDDIARIKTASDPQMAPGGERVAFVIKTMDVEKNKYFSHIHVVTRDGGDGSTVRQWTRSNSSEGSPRWSPDGKWLAFTSGREEKKSQIFLLPAEGGGEAERVTNLPQGGIGAIKWSPDGSRIAFTFRAVDEDRREEAAEERKKKERSSPPRVITRLHYREEGTGFVGAGRWHLHLLDVATRAVTPITSGEHDYGAFCWSPDGTKIAFTRNTAPDPDLLPNATGLFVRTLGENDDDDDAPTELPCPAGPKYSLAWSPDGTKIAYLGHDKADEVWGVTNTHAWVVGADGGEPARDLTPNWDVHCGNVAMGDANGAGDGGPHWSADGKSLLLLASERGGVDVYRIEVDGDGVPPKRLTEGTHAVTGFTADARTENLALLLATPTDAGDLYVLSPGSSFFRRLTRLNQDLFDEIDLQSPIAIDAPSPDGHTVPGWVLLPPDHADDPTPRPTLLYIHGGPHLMYAHTLFHEYQALAAAGFTVIFPNPRGSKGYGEAWTGAIKGDWGDPAHADVMACVDHAIERGWADPDRLGVVGGSYGGYLTAWVVGHTDRFKAAAPERGVYNLVSMAGTCDFIWIDRGYFDANTTDAPGEYLRNSPLTYAGNVTTPLLIIHSEGDLRCPIEQAEQYYAALRRQGKDVTFLRYGPESNHELSRGGPPDLRLDRQRRIHAWFKKHLMNEEKD